MCVSIFTSFPDPPRVFFILFLFFAFHTVIAVNIGTTYYKGIAGCHIYCVYLTFSLILVATILLLEKKIYIESTKIPTGQRPENIPCII